MSDKQYYPGEEFQQVFDYLSENHNLTLTISEMCDLIDLIRRLYPSQPPAVKGAWVSVSIKRPDGWQLCRFTGFTPTFPLKFAPHVICDFAGKTYDGDTPGIEWLDPESAPPAAKGVIEWVYTAQGLPKDGDIVFVEYKDGDCGHIEYLEVEREWFTKKIHRWLNESDEPPNRCRGWEANELGPGRIP